MDLISRKDNAWTVNFNPLLNYINSLDNKDHIVEDIKKFLTSNLANNYLFMSDYVFICRNNIKKSYPFTIILEEDGTTFSVDLTPEYFINYYESIEDHLNVWQKGYIKLLKYYTSDKYQSKKLNETIEDTDISYKNIKTYLLLSKENFLKLILADRRFGQSFYNLVFVLMGAKNVIDDGQVIFKLSDEEIELAKSNIESLRYYYEPNMTLNDAFPVRNHINKNFTLNDNLKRKILDKMPSDYDDFEKAYYIYLRLCKMFYYDEEYFCYSYGTISRKRKDEPKTNHGDIKRLNDIDINSGVICGEITMLYVKFLELLNIPYQIMGYDNNLNVRYYKMHIKVRFKTGEYLVDADAGHGVFNSDMSSIKIFNQVHGFKLVPGLPVRVQDEFNKKTAKVEEYIASLNEENEFDDALEVYENEYAKKENVSFKEKIDILKYFINRLKSPYIVMISWINELVEKLFGKDNNNIHVEFIINNNPTNPNLKYELAIAIIYNENEDIFEDYLSNTFLVITEDRHLTKYDALAFQSKFDNKEFDYTSQHRKEKYDFWEVSNEQRNRK